MKRTIALTVLSALLTGLWGVVLGVELGERKGRIDVASGQWECTRQDDGRDVEWECKENEQS